MTTKHLSIQQPANTVWCGAHGWDVVRVSSAAKTTCRACLDAYIKRAWAPSASTQPVCRPPHGDYCDQRVTHEGDMCAGHANAAAQYACE